MAGGKLEVQIGADITDFEKKIKEVEFDIKELSKVKLDRLKLGLDTSEINAQIKDAKNNLNSLKTTVKDTGNAIGGQFTKQVGNGGNTLMQFSRIAQDAPFGIMGIGNNITATAESFSYLKQQTGSTGGALKALASSVMGTGGILLGVSLLTTGLTLLSQSGLTLGDIVGKLTGKFDALGSEMGKANAEAVKNASSEITGFKALLVVASDLNTSMQKRNLAVDELQKKYPAYLGNLSRDQILNGDTARATDELSKAIIAKAKAQAFANRIADLAEKSLKNDLEAAKGRKELIRLENELLLARNNTAGAQYGGTSAEGAGIDAVNRAIQNQKEDINDLIKANKANANTMSIYTKEVEKATDASILLGQEGTKVKPVKTFETPQVQQVGGLIAQPLVIPAVNSQPFASSLRMLPEMVSEATIAMVSALENFNQQASEIISTSIVATFTGLGDALGTALATGGNVIESIGGVILNAMGSLLKSLGQALIQLGVGMVAAKLAIKNPYTAIAAGVAMVALGAAFSSKANESMNKTFGGGGGGGVSSATGAGSRNESYSSSGFSSGGSQGGTVVFEIAGQKLIGVLSNTLSANRRLGGSIGL